jgi:dynein heavy chain 2, cytosolic
MSAQARKGGAQAAQQQLDMADEATIVVRAACATKLPTLTFADNGRFRGLLADLFPGVQV